MKRLKKIMAMLLLMLLVASPVVLAASQPVEVQAAAKTVLKNKYYGYENGKRVCNQWRTIKVGNRSFRFYFDKNGRAYHADRNYVGTTGIVVKKINGRYYGFDYQGHMMKGIRCGITSEDAMPGLYYFNSNGVFNRQKTTVYRNASKTYKNARQIKKLLGKYSKMHISKFSCFGNGSDVTYIYGSLALSVFRPAGKGASAEVVEGIMQRD